MLILNMPIIATLLTLVAITSEFLRTFGFVLR